MRKKMRLIAMLSAMILSAGTMSVPAFANTGENTGGTTEETVIYAEEFDDADGVIPAEEIGSPDNNIQAEERKTSPSDHSDSGTRKADRDCYHERRCPECPYRQQHRL